MSDVNHEDAFSFFFSDRFIGSYGAAYADQLAAAERHRPLNHGLLRRGVLQAETYLDRALDAHTEDDVAAMAEALLVACGFVVTALDMLEASECSRNTSAGALQ